MSGSIHFSYKSGGFSDDEKTAALQEELDRIGRMISNGVDERDLPRLVGRLCFYARSLKRFKQDEIARILGVSATDIVMLENGLKRFPRQYVDDYLLVVGHEGAEGYFSKSPYSDTVTIVPPSAISQSYAAPKQETSPTPTKPTTIQRVFPFGRRRHPKLAA